MRSFYSSTKKSKGPTDISLLTRVFMETGALDQREYFSQLFQKYVDNRCSPAETDELLAYLKTHGFNEIYDHHTDGLKDRNFPTDLALRARLEKRLQTILSEELPDSGSGQAPVSEPVRTRIPGVFSLRRIAAAAAIFIGLGISAYFFFKPAHQETATTQSVKPVINDAIPGSNKPILTLAGGQKITLDSTAGAKISRLADTKINNASAGKLTYEELTITPTDYAKAVLEYNTLDNPRGSSVTNLTLSDGTKVWLNAGSSITYPVAFASNQRNVEITGETYFEVAHNPASPFTVKKKNSDTRITVLGTHFNVNAYDDETETKITLLEGAVNVATPANHRRLSPGEQALIHDGEIKLKANADIESTMAWKNNQFILKGTDLAMLLRQIARWYDVDIDYKNIIPSKKFGGSISRNVNLSTVMEALKENGINCSLTGKKLTVD